MKIVGLYAPSLSLRRGRGLSIFLIHIMETHGSLSLSPDPDPDPDPVLLFYRSPGWIARLIRWQTRSPYSHVAVFTGADVVESREGKGVRIVESCDSFKGTEIDVYSVSGAGVPKENILPSAIWLKEQLGKRYDWSSVLRFVTRRQASRQSAKVWFCSELAFVYATKLLGAPLLQNVEPWGVSPGLLSRSPLLKLQRTISQPADGWDLLGRLRRAGE